MRGDTSVSVNTTVTPSRFDEVREVCETLAGPAPRRVRARRRLPGGARIRFARYPNASWLVTIEVAVAVREARPVVGVELRELLVERFRVGRVGACSLRVERGQGPCDSTDDRTHEHRVEPHVWIERRGVALTDRLAPRVDRKLVEERDSRSVSVGRGGFDGRLEPATHDEHDVSVEDLVDLTWV